MNETPLTFSEFPVLNLAVDLAASKRSRILSLIEYEIALLAPIYPDILDWFSTKIRPSLFNGKRERSILVILENNDSTLVGFSILKDTVREKKICTLVISEPHRGKGFGDMLLRASFACLGTTTPMLSISSASIASFQPYIDKYGWRMRSAVPDCYVSGVVEYVFN